MTTTIGTPALATKLPFRVLWRGSGRVICECPTHAEAQTRAEIMDAIALKAEPSTKVQYRDFDGSWLDVEDLL